jgi:hypothetical protein
MKRSTLAVVLLSVALLASNLWWAYVMVDAGVSASYRHDDLDRHHAALGEAIAIAPVAARASATREEVLAAARAAAKGDQGFEKEGLVWVGELGYRFDADGRLIEVRTNWSPF